MRDTALQPIPSGSRFDAVHEDEIELLKHRRTWVHALPDRPPGAGTAGVEEISAHGAAETSKTGRNFRTWNTVGLALSGGGIRSATFSLGVLQALDVHRLTHQFDYLSTVSGGGYIGSALSSTLQESGGQFVFGGHGVIRDTDAVGHLRNFSNYLLPRDRSFVRNAADAVAVVGRGLVSNLIIVAATIALLVALTICAYPSTKHVPGTYLLGLVNHLLDVNRLLDLFRAVAASILGKDAVPPPPWPFALTFLCIALLVAVWTAWALWRSCRRQLESDVSGPILRAARVLVIVTVIMAFLDLQPVILFYGPGWIRAWGSAPVLVPGTIVATAVSFLSGRMGTFLRSTETHGGRGVLMTRIAAKALILLASLFVPLLLYAAFLWLTLTLMEKAGGAWIALVIGIALALISWPFSPNANSLHRFYRDRLSKAFLFTQVEEGREPPPSPGIFTSLKEKAVRIVRKMERAARPAEQPAPRLDGETGGSTSDTEVRPHAAAGGVWGKAQARASTVTHDTSKLIPRDPMSASFTAGAAGVPRGSRLKILIDYSSEDAASARSRRSVG